jgi:hypothetical protein
MAKDLKVLVADNNILVPKLEKSTSYISGSASLVQRIVKCLLTIPGSDLLYPEFGVGLQSVLPRVYDSRDVDKHKMTATEAVLRAEKQLKEDDAASNDKPDARLRSLFVKDVSYSMAASQWIVELSVRTMSNQVFNFQVAPK